MPEDVAYSLLGDLLELEDGAYTASGDLPEYKVYTVPGDLMEYDCTRLVSCQGISLKFKIALYDIISN